MQGLRRTSPGRRFLWASVMLLTVGLPLPAMADSLSIKKVAEYRNANRVKKVLREECRIDTRLPEMVQDKVGKLSLFSQVSLTDDPLTAQHDFALVASIISLEAPPGAGWSTGTKFLKIKATLYRNQENVGEFVRAERTVGNNDPITNATRNTSNCRIAERLATNLSEQLAVWIKQQNIQISETTGKSLSH